MGTIKGTKKGSFFWFEPDDPRLIVITDKSHRLYDSRVELPIDASMVKSIADPNIGILEPILVRKVGDNYEVVDGRQRVRAARQAKQLNTSLKIRIPAIPRTAKDAEAARNSTIANVQRTEDSPYIKGENAARMIEMGYTDIEVSDFYGVSFLTVKGWIGFSETASDELKWALDSGVVTYTKARSISSMNHEKQAEALEKATAAPKPRRGPPNGPRRRKIKIVATEREESGFDVQVESKCKMDELDVIIDALVREHEKWKSETDIKECQHSSG